MSFSLAENPWPVLAVFVMLALVCFGLFKKTQYGKYLVMSLVMLGLGGIAVLAERWVVTDRERVESLIGEIRRGVERSDADAILAQLELSTKVDPAKLKGRKPPLQLPIFQVNGIPMPESGMRAIVRAFASTLEFDYLSVSNLQIDVGAQTRAGQASFQVMANGMFTGTGDRIPFTSAKTEWTFGVREVEPGVWKVTRIQSSHWSEVMKFLGNRIESEDDR